MFPGLELQEMSTSRLVVWLIASHADAPSLRDVRNATSAADADIVLVRSISEALAAVATAVLPDVVVVCQSCPDEWPRGDAEMLIGALPLSRWVVAFGPWCESLGRTEAIWPAAWTVPLRLAPARITETLCAGSHDQPPVPPTFSRDDVFARDSEVAVHLADRASKATSVRSACVDADDREFGLLLSNLLGECDIEIVGFEDAELLLISVSIPTGELPRRVQTHLDHRPERSVVVVSDLATSHDADELRRAGAAAVISQLRAREELARYLVARG